MDKLLLQLDKQTNRSAHFKTVIALNVNKEQYLFKGIVQGEITTQKKGGKGFGYDPIFKPNGYDKTFAELPISVKNKISHRAKAIEQLLAFFKNRTHVDN
jgi:XTP/dITP diphosphohydrolase